MVAKAIETLESGLVVGHARLGRFGQGRGSVSQQVHDGDTVTVEADGNFGVRFLGVDAPEVSCPLPGHPKSFVKLDDPRWAAVLTDPFVANLPPFATPLTDELRAHVDGLASDDLAANHARAGKAATEALEAAVAADLQAAGATPETFRFFCAFAGEIMDRYGRMLVYLHADQPGVPRPQRLLSYNERLLQLGWVSPYFIWPNINPFRKASSIERAVPAPGTAGQVAQAEASLRNARIWTAQARQQQIGLYAAADPLRLLPFELRYLARRQPPDRWLVDLTAEDDLLLPPQAYPRIANPEDRLHIPSEYVPLWVDHGWQRTQ